MTYQSLASFGIYSPASLGWVVPSAGDLTEFAYEGVSFGSMHKNVVGLFTAILDELVPQIPSKRLVAGQCGCYNPKSVTVGGSPSFHAYGIAVDINWGSNPMNVRPKPTLPDSLPFSTAGIATSYGSEWGGSWSSPIDWMHIECHLSPSVARTVKPLAHGDSGRAKPIQPPEEEEPMYTAFRDVTDHAIYLAAPNYWKHVNPTEWSYALARREVILDPNTQKPKLWDISHGEIGVQRGIALGSEK